MSADPEWCPEGTFERKLLDSAKEDAGAGAVDEAWARFARQMGRPVSDDDRRGGRHRDRSPEPSTPAAGSPVTWPRAVRWLLLGALGGSALTAGFIVRRDRPKVDGRAAESAVRDPVPDGGAIRPAPLLIPVSQGLAEAPARPPERRSRGVAAATLPRGNGSSGARSTLAEEVSRIDTARTAISSGDPDQAIRLIERYHREFPGGALANDADVVALEAAALRGDRTDVSRRARVFLSRHPNDPQAARVRAIVGHFPDR